MVNAVATQKRVRLCLYGQSNELGSAEGPIISGPFGNPLKDPIGPNNGPGSRWPHLAGLMGQRGVWLSVHNSAVGSTSIVDSWVGGCRAWANNMIVTRGSYLLSSGGFWRCNLAAGSVAASTAQPTGTSNVTGADSIPWVYVGLPTVEDVDGAVYAMGSARFDPNGYCAAAVAAFAAPGFDIKAAYIAIGQGDKTLTTSQARFAKGLQNAAAHAIASGADRVLMGFTCWGKTAGLTAYYDSTLVPGWQDALAALQAQFPGKVYRASNLYAELPLSTRIEVAGTTGAGGGVGVPGILTTDKLHMNAEMQKLAAALDDPYFLAAGC